MKHPYLNIDTQENDKMDVPYLHWAIRMDLMLPLILIHFKKIAMNHPYLNLDTQENDKMDVPYLHW